jgi:hypothetical protein
MQTDLPMKIISYRKFETGMLRVIFVTKDLEEEEIEERQHLLWIQLIEIEGRTYVKHRCDCKYFDYRLFRPARRLFGEQNIDGDIVVVVDPMTFVQQKKLFNIDKHAYLALKELFKYNVQIDI